MGVFSKLLYPTLFEFLLTLGGLGRENIDLLVQWRRKMPSRVSLCLREYGLASEQTYARSGWVAQGPHTCVYLTAASHHHWVPPTLLKNVALGARGMT